MTKSTSDSVLGWIILIGFIIFLVWACSPNEKHKDATESTSYQPAYVSPAYPTTYNSKCEILRSDLTNECYADHSKELDFCMHVKDMNLRNLGC